MPLGDRDYMRRPVPRDDTRGLRSLTVRLILVCAVVWLFVRTVAARGRGDLVLDLAVSGTALGDGKVWTLLTHAVTHVDTGHILFNAYGLWLFGRMIEPTFRRRTFLVVILAAMLAGGLAHVLHGLFAGSPQVPAIGVSGVVMAYVVIAALRFPQARMVLFPIPFTMPLWALGALYVLLDVTGLVRGAGGIAFAAHLGGAATGVVAHLLTSGRIVLRARGPAPPRALPPDDPRRIDALLEKIHREGIGSLSAAERAELDRLSRR